jgi:hypothetical protein
VLLYSSSMLNLVLWIALLAGTVALIAFAWRSAMRRRGFKLLELLQGEQVLRHAVDVPVRRGDARGAGGESVGLLSRRGTLVLTRKRLAGFAHRARFVLVRGPARPAAVIEATDGWLVIRPAGRKKGGRSVPAFRFQVPDAEGWSRDVKRALRL